MISSIVTIALVVGGPLLTRQGVNDAMAGDTSALPFLGTGLILIAAFDFAGDYIRRFAAGRLSLWVQHTLRSRVFDSIQRLDGPGQDSLRTGQIVSRTNSDLQQVQTMLQMCPVPVAVVTYYVFGIAVMLWLSPLLTLIAIGVIVSLGATALHTRRRVFAASAGAQQDLGEVTERIRSRVEAITVVKSFAQEAREIRWLERACRALFTRRMDTARVQAAPGATMLALPLAGQAALLLLGGWQVMNGVLDLGTFVAFAAFLTMLTGPTRVFASFLVIAQRTHASAERIFELIDTRAELADGTQEPPAPAGIAFENVRFSYTSDEPVLEDISFTVRPGETVAVIGPSGSGTSTLALLAPRFYDVTGGSIRLGDPGGESADVRDLALEGLRRSVGVVFEEPFLFAATVRENIAYGHPEASEDDVRSAAIAAGAAEFIDRLPEGYDTPVAESGQSLSGGQRQRIALARALLSAPRVLIVDDATSAVDSRTEAGINQALRGYAGADRATLLIARRRSTLELADRIVVLEAGRTVDIGTPSELHARCRLYRELLAGEGEEIDRPRATRALWPDEEETEPTLADRPEPAGTGTRSRLLRLPERVASRAREPHVVRVLGMLGPVKGLFGLALLLISLDALATVLIPVLVQRGIDTGIAHGDLRALLACALGALALVGVSWLCYAGQTLASSRASESVQYAVRVRSFRHVLGLELPFFERERSGSLLTRLTVDVDSIAKFLQNGLANGIMSLATMLGIGIAMIVFAPVLAAAALAPLPLVAVATIVFRRLSSRAYDRARDDIGKVNSSLQESISGLRVMQSHGRQGTAAAVFRALSDRHRISRQKAQRYIALYFPFVVFCSQASYALVLVVGAHMIASGSLSPGVLAAFLLFLGQFYAPIQQLATIVDAYNQARVGIRRTDELLSLPLPERTGTEPVGTLRGDIRIEGLVYRHEEASPPALDGADLHLPAGKTLALVGTTGAGKTTLVKLIAGLYRPDAGRILVDGRDLARLDEAEYRRRVGTVSQDPQLFDATVSENIRYPRPDASDEEVERAAADAGALDAVARLPRGFRQPLSGGGANLSAGQRQLLSLARAHLARADILLLDEATASLDAHAEAAVLAALHAPDRRRTTVLVAHRLSTAAACDRIAVMEGGRVVEHGGHEELLAAGGRYAALWRAHAPGYPTTHHPDGLLATGASERKTR